jgi:hypothetical protein
MDAETWAERCGPYNFKGFGPPDGGCVWFIGLEFRGDGGCHGCDEGEIVYPFSSLQIHSESTGRRPTHIYNYMSRIMWGLFGRQATHIVHRDTRFLQNDGAFFTNLYVFPQPTHLTFTSFMSTLGFADLNEYWVAMQNYRFSMLRRFWDERPRAFAVCFGEDEGFRALFQLSDRPHHLLADGQIRYFPHERVFLCPFFGLRGRGMGALKLKVVDEIATTMTSDWPTSCARNGCPYQVGDFADSHNS